MSEHSTKSQLYSQSYIPRQLVELAAHVGDLINTHRGFTVLELNAQSFFFFYFLYLRTVFHTWYF